MPVWSIVLLVIIAILVVALIALIIVGNKLRKKQTENQAQIDLVYRKTFRKIEPHGKWDLLPLRKCAVIPDHAVCRPVFAEMHFKTWNSGNRTGEIGFDLFKIPFFCKGSELT